MTFVFEAKRLQFFNHQMLQMKIVEHLLGFSKCKIKADKIYYIKRNATSCNKTRKEDK